MSTLRTAGRTVPLEGIGRPFSIVAFEPSVLVTAIETVTTVNIPIALTFTLPVDWTVPVALSLTFPVAVAIPIPVPISISISISVDDWTVTVSVAVSITVPITIPPAFPGPAPAAEGVSIVQVGDAPAASSSFPVTTAATADGSRTRMMADTGRAVGARRGGGNQAVAGVASQSGYVEIASAGFSGVPKVSGGGSRPSPGKTDAGVSGIEVTVSSAPIPICITAERRSVPGVTKIAVAVSISVSVAIAITVAEVTTRRIASPSSSKGTSSGRVDQGLGAPGGFAS